ncbi:LuxR C-terminal-related transcriptional regulator [Streptomyces sp. NPDC002306]
MRLVIAEGSAVLRAGLAHVLSVQGHRLAAPVQDARVLPALVAEHRPDVVIANARLAPTWNEEGVQACLQVRRRHPGTGVLLFSERPEPGHLARLFAGDTAGLAYLLQDRMTDPAHLADTLARLAAGGTVLDPRAGGGPAPAAAPGLGALSERESQVLALMAQGRTNSAIANRLVVSQGTVEKRVAAVFDKLGIPGSAGDNRRVLAVLRYLSARPGTPDAGGPLAPHMARRPVPTAA